MAFCKPSCQSFFSSCVSSFSPGDRYFHKTSKRTIRQVSRQISHRIKDERNRRYCEECIAIDSQSHKIVHEMVHEYVKMISVQPALRMELGGSKDVLFLKYYDTLQWESRFTLQLNATKNTNYIEKWFKRKSYKIKLPIKKLNGSISLIYFRSGVRGLQRFAFFKYYNVLK